MQVILLQKVENLGDLGDKVRVKNGYGRNFLVPTGRAVSATAENLAAFEARRAELEKQAAGSLETARARKEQLEAMTVTVARKAGEQGRLFGSVGSVDIAEAVTAAGAPVTKKEIRLAGGPFHSCGEFDVDVHLHTDVNARIKLVIVPE